MMLTVPSRSTHLSECGCRARSLALGDNIWSRHKVVIGPQARRSQHRRKKGLMSGGGSVAARSVRVCSDACAHAQTRDWRTAAHAPIVLLVAFAPCRRLGSTLAPRTAGREETWRAASMTPSIGLADIGYHGVTLESSDCGAASLLGHRRKQPLERGRGSPSSVRSTRPFRGTLRLS